MTGGRRQARVEGAGLSSRQPDGTVADQVDQYEPTAQGGNGSRAQGVGVVADEPARPLPRALPAGPLGVGQVLVVVAQDRPGIGDEALEAGVDVEHPQGVDGIRSRRRPQEDHPAPVAGHPERAGGAEAEALRAGRLAGEGQRQIGHRRAPYPSGR